MKLSTIAIVLVVTVFLAIMAQKAVASVSANYAALSSSQQALLDANI